MSPYEPHQVRRDFEFGEGDEVLGIFAHLDVVPAGSGWDTDPYEPVIKDGRKILV